MITRGAASFDGLAPDTTTDTTTLRRWPDEDQDRTLLFAAELGIEVAVATGPEDPSPCLCNR